jgi:hypothetical protein
MSTQTPPERIGVQDFGTRCREAMIPVSSKFSYFPASPMGEEDVREYVEEPVAALPASICAALEPVCIGLVPFLEKRNGKEKNGPVTDYVTFDRPAETRQLPSIRTASSGQVTLLFGIKDRPVADYHYHFYHEVAELAADRLGEDPLSQFHGLLREELRSRVHGEVDQEGWHLKEALMRRQVNLRKETKLFRDYARQALVDTLTLYLHGICCDIDVEPGPRQLPSRYLRKRLTLLESLYPPPDGYAVFPEQVTPT